MKRFALGALLYSPQRFGKIMVGDFIDALTGYNEAETEKVKSLAEILRTSTTLLWNVHQVEASHTKSKSELWPLPWDDEESAGKGNAGARSISDKDIKEIEDLHEKILNGEVKIEEGKRY